MFSIGSFIVFSTFFLVTVHCHTCENSWSGPWERDVKEVKKRMVEKKERLERLGLVMEKIHQIQRKALDDSGRNVTWELVEEEERLTRKDFSVVAIDDGLLIGFSEQQENLLRFALEGFEGSWDDLKLSRYSLGYLDGKLFVVGGFVDGEYQGDVWVLDLETIGFSSFALGMEIADAASVQLDNRLYLYGGRNHVDAYDGVYRIDMKEKSVQTMGHSGNGIHSAGMGHFRCKFYVVGGQRISGEFVDYFAQYQSDFDYIDANVPIRLSSFAMIVYDGYLMIFGGISDDGVRNDFIRLDLRQPSNEFEFEKVPVAGIEGISRFGYAVYNQGLYLVGGVKDGEAQGSMYRLDLWKVTNPRITTTPMSLICFGVPSAENACSGHGNCVDYDVCQCEADWSGNECHLEKFQWTEVEMNPESLNQRNYHSSVVYQDKMWIFAGFDSVQRDDLWHFSFATSMWEEVNVTTLSRFRHSAVVYQDKMWIFAGMQPYRNDLWYFSFTNFVWNEVDTSTPPNARRSHSAVVYQDKMWIFAGSDGSQKNDLWSFTFSNSTWEENDVIQTKPGTRENHSASLYQHAMWIFGGMEGSGRRNDLWKFNFSNSTWIEIIVNESPPSRFAHSAVVYNDKLWVFGGFIGYSTNDFWTFNFTDLLWSEVALNGPSPRFGHSAEVYQDRMWIFGGSQQSGVFYNDMWTYTM